MTKSRSIFRRMISRFAPNPIKLWRMGYLYQKRYGNFIKVIAGSSGNIVQKGPFSHMKYIKNAFPPILIGSFEEELHAIIEKAIQTNYSTILNVGSAEGYYAVGMAMRKPNALIFAYDIQPLKRKLCRELARLNGVQERVKVQGECNIGQLNRMNLSNTLLICDCEGYELELLQPDRVLGLRHCDILVELHDLFIEGITPAILSRFSQSHQITLVDSLERDPMRYSILEGLSKEDKKLAVSEGRQAPMQWAFMEAIDNGFRELI